MEVEDQGKVGAYRSLLANRPFRLWFSSALASSLGDWLGLFALQVLVISLAPAGSRIALFGLGGIMMARLLPSIVFGPLAGVLADRADRKKLMVAADLIRAGLFVVIAYTRTIWLLLLLVLVVECLTILYIAAKNAVLPNIVERSELTEANQLTLLVTYGPLPFGAAIAAGVTALVGWLAGTGLTGVDPTVASLLLNGGSFLVGGWLISRMPLDRRERGSAEDGHDDPGPVRQLLEGLAFIRDRTIISALILGVVGIFFGAGIVVALGPEFVRTDLGRSENDWYGLMTTVGMGLLVGMVASPFLARRMRKERLFAGVLVPSAVLVLAVGLVPGFAWALWLGAVLGAVTGTSFVLGFTLLHERTPDGVRARTFATFYTAARVAMFAALALAPFAAGAIGTGELPIADVTIPYSGTRITVVLGGVLALVGAVPGAIGMLRGVRSEERERDADDSRGP